MFEMSMCLPTSHSNRDGLTSNNHTNGTKDRHGTCLKTLKKPTRPGGTYLNLHGYAHSEYGQLCGKKRKKTHIIFRKLQTSKIHKRDMVRAWLGKVMQKNVNFVSFWKIKKKASNRNDNCPNEKSVFLRHAYWIECDNELR